MHVRFSGILIAADCMNFLLLFEPGRYPVAYFPKGDISPNTYNAPSTPTCTTPTKRSEMARLLSVKAEAAEEDRDSSSDSSARSSRSNRRWAKAKAKH